jgi:RND family efflux transporter MFP subunit
MIFYGCNSNRGNSDTREHGHEHVEGHDHGNEGHDHSNEGHDHGNEGHDHGNEGHDHGNEGHDHGNEGHTHEGCSHENEEHNREGEHTDEIRFTRQQAEAAGLQTETVEPGAFNRVIKTSGQIQAAQGDEVTIIATSAGVVSFANPSVTDGTAVRAGETIVTVSAENLRDNPAIIAKINYETALREFKRAEELVADKIISAKEFEQTRSRYETAKTVYDAQAKNVTPKGIKVSSPVSGYIKNKLAAQGEYVEVGQPIATVSQNRRLQLRAEVPEKYFKDLKGVNNANFKMAYDNTLYKLSDLNGRPVSFGKSSNSRSFHIPVTFEFDNVGEIIPGSFAEIYLLSASQNDVVSVPVAALTEEQGLYFVYLQLDEEGYEKREIVPGADNGERVQVVSGLKQGDVVVVKGVYQVKLAANASILPEGHTH